MNNSELLELELEILHIINCTINGKYVGGLHVENPEKDVWELHLHFHVPEAPLLMSYQGTVDEFKKFIHNEIRTRQMERFPFWSVDIEYPALICVNGKWVLDTDNII